MALLEAHGLGCTFPGGKRAVRELDLALEPGDLLGLIGPDGAGKTTTFRMLMGLQKPTSGRVHRGRIRLGYVPQLFSLAPDLTVEENMRLQARLYGMRGEEDRIRTLLDSVDLARFSDRLSGALSGGMKQKLALCVALLPRPEVLLLDEPTTGVDPVSRREFWSLLHAIHDEGVAILFSTPYMDEAEYGLRLALFHDGQVLASGNPESFQEGLDGVFLQVEVTDRRVALPLLRDLGPLDLFSEGTQVRLRVRPDEVPDLLVRIAALTGVRAVRPAEGTLEDAFLAALVRAEASHD